MKVSRRGLLAGAALGGGLLLAWSLVPRDYGSPLASAPGETAFHAWLKIANDGVVTVAVPQLEMGQGITTLLPQIVAMELGADWRQIAVEPAPISPAYANFPLAARWAPLWQPLIPALADDADDFLVRRWAERNSFTATAEGMSLAAYEMPCREAAASARSMLAMAAAERWDVDWEECSARDGFILYGEKSLSFGELAERAGEMDAPDPPPLRPAPLAGSSAGPSRDQADEVAGADQPFPRLDLPSKVDGSFLFAGDVRLPDMVYAAIRHGPRDRAELVGYHAQRAAGVPGLVGVVGGKRWLAAAATNWWAAEQALEAMAPRFVAENIVSSERIEAALDEGARTGRSVLVAQRGNGDEGYSPNFALRYDVAPAVHATIETTTVTARLTVGRLELWMATQAPQSAREAAAKAIGISAADVVLYPMPAGGSFDRRLEHDQAIEAALIARELGRPVQLIWSRAEEQLALQPRTPVAALLGAEVSPDGRIGAFRARLALPPTTHEFGRRLFGNRTTWAAIEEVAGEADPMALEGMMPPYAIPDVAIRHVPVQITLPTGRLGSNADGYSCFFLESFIDEVAQRHALEPLSYRISMLGGDPRLAEVLQRAARLGEWDGGAQGTGQGIACHRMQRGEAIGRIALVATATAGEGGVRVSRLSAAVDIGRVINRDVALQQIEGGLIFGLGLALGSATEYQDGYPTHARLAALALPTLADTPRIEVDLIESEAEPFDPGEIAVPPVAPAVANALYSATGLRLRRLPLLSGGL